MSHDHTCNPQVEKSLFEKNLNKEYALITGVPEFVKASVEFALTKDNEFVKNNCVSPCTCTVCNGCGFFIT